MGTDENETPTGRRTMTYQNNDLVTMRLSGEAGVIVDREDDVQVGWVYLVKFSDGSTKWYRGTDVR